MGYRQMIRKWNMTRPLRIAFPGAFYRVTARGNERKAVFKSIRDRQKFLEYLETATERYHALIHAYCLMDNHYHLLLEKPSGNLPQIMQHINGAYTTYFNVTRARAGQLFQGRYKATLVEMDEERIERFEKRVFLSNIEICPLLFFPNQINILNYCGWLSELAT